MSMNRLCAILGRGLEPDTLILRALCAWLRAERCDWYGIFSLLEGEWRVLPVKFTKEALRSTKFNHLLAMYKLVKPHIDYYSNFREVTKLAILADGSVAIRLKGKFIEFRNSYMEDS